MKDKLKTEVEGTVIRVDEDTIVCRMYIGTETVEIALDRSLFNLFDEIYYRMPIVVSAYVDPITNLSKLLVTRVQIQIVENSYSKEIDKLIQDLE